MMVMLGEEREKRKRGGGRTRTMVSGKAMKIAQGVSIVEREGKEARGEVAIKGRTRWAASTSGASISPGHALLQALSDRLSQCMGGKCRRGVTMKSGAGAALGSSYLFYGYSPKYATIWKVLQVLR